MGFVEVGSGIGIGGNMSDRNAGFAGLGRKTQMPLAVILSNVESLARETGRSIRSGAIQVYFRKLLEGK